MPTLQQEGYSLKTLLEGDVIQMNAVTDAWALTHHTLFQTYLNQLTRAASAAALTAVGREELNKAMKEKKREDQRVAKKMKKFSPRKTMPLEVPPPFIPATRIRTSVVQ